MSEDIIIVLITTPNLDVARSIAQQLLLQKKAACVSIVPHVQSLYWWEDKITEAQEFLLLCKTSADCFDAEFHTYVNDLHPYDLPEIISVPVNGGFPPYLDWIRSLTS